MNKIKIHVILGSIREGRAGERVARWFMNAMKEYDRANLELVDLLDFPMPLFADGTPSSMREGPHPNATVQRWLDKVAEANGYIIITPEYNHGYPSALKNALDYPYKEWNNKPVGFVSYGSLAGGARVVEQLRQVVGELRMFDVRDQVLIPNIWAAFDEQGHLKNEEQYLKNAKLVVEGVSTLAITLKNKS
ncbi:MAG: NADPH-dependent FMN reductase [uncultured bacterium]|nr:MAG: NADPH-dependent FMN reductase [uncultured bacterium]KKT76895.1 MAG: NADPH-dependent FMN reductase [Candidatus Peregrinibacteria bacterium GW2011_GWA2_44_7]